MAGSRGIPTPSTRPARTPKRYSNSSPNASQIREDVEMNHAEPDTLQRRLEELEEIIAPRGSALVAFSGGVDSSLALAVAARALPKDRVLAVTSNNETYLPSELDLARGFVESPRGEHLVVPARARWPPGRYRRTGCSPLPLTTRPTCPRSSTWHGDSSSRSGWSTSS